MTTSDDQLSGWSERKVQSSSQSQTCSNKNVVTVWWSAAHLIHYSFLNPGETITSEKYAQQLDKMHQKLQCQQYWSTEWAQFSTTVPNHCHATSASKVEQIGL